MKALRFARTGDLAFLELVERPVPQAAPGEVLIRIEASGLNQSDVSNVLGKHPYTTLPRTPGRDFAGVVIEGPAELVGKPVWGTGKEFGFTRDGSHAQFMTAPASGVAVKPEKLSFAQAASCGVPYTTAWSALERCGVAKGCKLLVIGAAGAVGTAAVSLGRWRGADIVGAVRRGQQASSLEARGIRPVLLSTDRPLADLAKRCFPDGADVIFDTTGAWLPQAIPALAHYGRIAVIVAHGEGQVTVPVRDLYRRAGSIVGVNTLLYTPSDCARMLTEIGKAFDAGELPLPGGFEERPLEKGLETYADVNRKVRGKFIFVAS